MASPNYEKSLFIFRRDLRINDNLGLLAALEQSKVVVPIFIFEPQQIGKENEYRSTNAIQFMIESLEDLSEQLKKNSGRLYVFKGNTETIVKKIVSKEKIDALFINKDYTPFSLKRDALIRKICTRYKIDFFAHEDALLNDPEDIKTKNGTPYAVYTPFLRACRTLPVDEPKQNRKKNFYHGKVAQSDSGLLKKMYPKKNASLWVHGGTQEAAKLLRKIKNLANYKKTRDIPSLLTSNLSAHNKFGTISIRQVYHTITKTLGKSSILINQLYWRDFFYHVAYHSPFVFGQPYQEKYKKVWWSRSKKDFERWCSGTTGFPIVDAGMRQLNETGYMHNRVRLITASFLTKDLHIDWRWGEKYFAQQLVDYDPCVNNGNWQWVASTGCDAQPYFRIFNPWLQQKKFDPEAEYIHTWVKELKKVPPKIIHNWQSEKSPEIKDYPRPMVCHKEESAKAKEYFKRA